jgi:hypothetical protein
MPLFKSRASLSTSKATSPTKENPINPCDRNIAYASPEKTPFDSLFLQVKKY